MKAYLEDFNKKESEVKATVELNQRKETECISIQQEELRLKQMKLLKEEEDILANKSKTLIDYYDKNITPILKKGIYILSQRMPEDPIDFLVSFLLC
jgi:hypothetical protein